MGNPLSKSIEELKHEEEDKKKQMEQQLDILSKMVKSKLEAAQHEMLIGEKGDQEIHAGTVVAKHKQTNITIANKGNQKIKDGLHNFFQGDFIGGLEKIVQVGADAVLGNSTIGESETSDMFIVWSHNALLRCDAYYYRWNFSFKGLLSDLEGVTGVCMSYRYQKN